MIRLLYHQKQVFRTIIVAKYQILWMVVNAGVKMRRGAV
jgi:hypothetical protein